MEGKQVPFLVDTGATRSAMKDPPPDKISPHHVPVMGFSGTIQHLPLTSPLILNVGHQTLSHPFVCSPQVPVNLLGRDLLIKMGVTILCSADGLVMTFPDGHSMNCSVSNNHTGNFLMMANPETHADIYWALLDPETPTAHGVLRSFLLWKPFLQSVHPYQPPPDPPHCTLLYDRDGDLEFYDA